MADGRVAAQAGERVSTVLAVVGHPDDECMFGASIAKWTSEGHQVYVLALADGETSRHLLADVAKERLRLRFEAFVQAGQVLGYRPACDTIFPDQRLDVTPLLDITRVIEAVIARVRPSIVYTHSPGDLNADHRRVHEAVLPAVRPKSGVKAVYCFEGPATMRPFAPTTFVEVTAEQVEQQIAAARCYGDELVGEEGRMRMRAAMGGAKLGVPFCQEFETVRCLQ
jgi:LmbE family N-acetylglucosaminyl deacetylase